MMKIQINTLITLAKEWSDFSYEENGWSCQDYIKEDLKVRCYFADNSDFRSVTLGSIQIYFHSTPSIQAPYTYFDTTEIKKVLKQYSEYLVAQKESYLVKSQEEIEEEKSLRIAKLKEELEQLTNQKKE